VLAIVNRSANVHSHEDAGGHLDKAIEICATARFQCIRMRGHCKWQTQHLARWIAQGERGRFGLEGPNNLKAAADDGPKPDWKPLKRTQPLNKITEPAKPANVTRHFIRECGYVHLAPEREDLAQSGCKPTACQHGYRIVVARRNLSREQGDSRLFDEIRYLFYISKDHKSCTAEQMLFQRNRKCDQESLIA